MIIGEMSKYDQAVATWIELNDCLPVGSVVWVDFIGLDGCETCGDGGGAALDYLYDRDGKRKSGTVLLDHPLSPGQFIAECAAILAEADKP